MRFEAISRAAAWPLAAMLVTVLGVFGCDSGGEPDDDFGMEEVLEYDDEKLGKADSIGVNGPPVSLDTSSTAVWEVQNQWEDTDTAAAREAGIAWGADSGLTWDDKYAAWVQSMGITPGHDTYYDTFMLTTPWGKEIPAPALECAEVAMFLRVTFASWYNLPFYLTSVDGSGTRVYFGHMGAVTRAGRYKSTPKYNHWYRDYTDDFAGRSDAYIRDNWPSDSKLRARAVGDGDEMGFLADHGEGSERGGHYFDQIFLNKRVGHFLRLLLNYFGSMNLASSRNTYNLKPQALRAGDVLVERWQRRGIGHVLVVKNVSELEGGKMEANLVSGSMPRRQPKWESGASSKNYFTNDYCGGVGETSDGYSYASLGGGLKRWRVAKKNGGYWRNTWMTADEASWINDTDEERIAARVAEFEDLLGEVDPAQLREAFLQMISDARNHLRQYPASCAARIRREEAFDKLYELNYLHFDMTHAETDAQYRILDDYVFAELEYDQSKTCCWNSSTEAMYQIVMDYNRERMENQCQEPAVFMALGGGYNLFSDYAESTGRGHLWVDWSADEHCPQSDVDNDTEAAHDWVPWCDIAGSTQPADCTDSYEPNDTPPEAASVTNGSFEGLQICEGDEDYFSIDAGADFTVRIEFTHADGDLDMALYQGSDELDRSQSVSDSEELSAAGGSYVLRVYGYNGATGHYRLVLSE
jgi:hypothetical protein